MSPEPSALRTGRTPLSAREALANKQAAPMDLGDETGSCIQARNIRLTQWFESWRGAMRRWLSSRSSIQPADLDDVAQEVFLRLIRYSNDTLVEYPQSYLFRIATNVVNEWRERARNKLPHDDAGLEALPEEPHREPESSMDRSLVNKQVRLAVEHLPPRQRAVLLLHINDELTYKQIAIKLKLSPRIVRRDIANAYMQLRCELHSVHTVSHAQPPLRAAANEHAK
jgi:RNA polymerase sigma factor (sigma-70 family)